MDIADFKPSERVIEILHPKTGVELGIKVTLLSINDDRLKSIKRKISDEKLRLEAKGKNFKTGDIEENRYNLICQAMTGWTWEGEAVFHGEKPDFNRRNIIAVMKELTWFCDQVEEAISDEQAFFTT